MLTRSTRSNLASKDGMLPGCSPAIGHRSQNRRLRHDSHPLSENLSNSQVNINSSALNSNEKYSGKSNSKAISKKKCNQENKENIFCKPVSKLPNKVGKLKPLGQHSNNNPSPSFKRRIIPYSRILSLNNTQTGSGQKNCLQKYDSVLNIFENTNLSICKESNSEALQLNTVRKSKRLMNDQVNFSQIRLPISKDSIDFTNTCKSPILSFPSKLKYTVNLGTKVSIEKENKESTTNNNVTGKANLSLDISEKQDQSAVQTDIMKKNNTNRKKYSRASKLNNGTKSKKRTRFVKRINAKKILKDSEVQKSSSLTQNHSKIPQNDEELVPISSSTITRSRTRQRPSYNSEGKKISAKFNSAPKCSPNSSNVKESHIRSSTNQQTLDCPLSKESTTKSKESVKKPIWKRDDNSKGPLLNFKVKRKSTRLSIVQNKDVYEFHFDSSQENGVTKNKRRRKVVQRKKIPKRGITKSSLLTTDPCWQPPIATSSIATQQFYSTANREGQSSSEGGAGLVNYSEGECYDATPFDSHMDDVPMDDAGYEASVSGVNETNAPVSTPLNPSTKSLPTTITSSTFNSPMINVPVDNAGYQVVVNGTNSTYSTPLNPSMKPLPSTTSSTPLDPLPFRIPTPIVNPRFPGVASTPRLEDDTRYMNSFFGPRPTQPVTVEEDLNLCFGFDESEEESNIGLSPVKKVAPMMQLDTLTLTMPSSVGELDPLPSRFVVPVCQQRAPRRGRGKVPPRAKETAPRPEGHARMVQSPAEECDRSVLFDEPDEEAEQPTAREEAPCLPTPSPGSALNESQASLTSFSPEKSFVKPLRRTYDRETLEEARRKFHEKYAGGCPATESDTEPEEPKLATCVSRRKKPAPRKPSRPPLKSLATTVDGDLPPKVYRPRKKRRKKSPKHSKENASPDSEASGLGSRPRKQSDWDKSVTDWISDINSHFSELEEVALVIE